MSQIKPSEVSEILKKQIEGFKSEVELEEVGTVLQVGDGIARIYGLNNVQANELIEPSCARMPVIFDIDQGLHWLNESTDEALYLLKPYPANKMGGFAVSNLINKPGINRPELIEPALPADQFGNYNLFD